MPSNPIAQCDVICLGGSVGRCSLALEGSFGGCKEADTSGEVKNSRIFVSEKWCFLLSSKVWWSRNHASALFLPRAIPDTSTRLSLFSEPSNRSIPSRFAFRKMQFCVLVSVFGGAKVVLLAPRTSEYQLNTLHVFT